MAANGSNMANQSFEPPSGPQGVDGGLKPFMVSVYSI